MREFRFPLLFPRTTQSKAKKWTPVWGPCRRWSSSHFSNRQRSTCCASPVSSPFWASSSPLCFCKTRLSPTHTHTHTCRQTCYFPFFFLFCNRPLMFFVKGLRGQRTAAWIKNRPVSYFPLSELPTRSGVSSVEPFPITPRLYSNLH